jgi:RNA polymerase sigma-70 factor (family 1)
MAQHEKWKVSDEELIVLVKNDQEKAFEELYNRYWEKLYWVAFRVLEDPAACQDIVQEIFVDFWNRRANIQVANLPAFLYKAVKFQVAKHLRNGKIKDTHLNKFYTALLVNDTDEAIALNELNALVEKSLSDLPERCREVFCLSRFENLSNKEIAQRLDISLSTVENHINKALKHLRFSMEGSFLLALMGLFL